MSPSTTTLEDPFAAVAQKIRADYARAGYRLAAFTEIAAAALTAIDPARQPKRALIEAALARLDQRANRACFHEATNVVPVYADDQFILTFHMWTTTFGNPHSHRWNGAFQNLSDPLVYVDYEFELEDRYDNDLHFGRRRQLPLRVLERGAVVGVEQERSIHGFGHTGFPGLTLAARARSVGAQTLDYWGPGLRVTTGPDDELARDATLLARTLRTLRLFDEDAFLAGLRRSLAASSLRTCVMLTLELLASAPTEADRFCELILASHPEAHAHEPALRAALAAKAFHDQTLTVLGACQTPRTRLLAALLRFCRDRDELDRVIEEHGASFGVTPASAADDFAELLALAGRGYLPEGAAGRALVRVFRSMFAGADRARILADLRERFSSPTLDGTVDTFMTTIRALALTARLLPSTTTDDQPHHS